MVKHVKRLLRQAREAAELRGMAVCARFPYLSNIYFCIDRGFEREHHAVLVGRLRYRESMSRGHRTGHVYRLRRNIHRLEKGLISRPRREVFARDYLPGTIASYEAFVTSLAPGDEGGALLAGWSTDVLSDYFAAVAPGQSPDVDRCRETFERLAPVARERACGGCAKRVPYVRDRTPLTVSIDDLRALAYRRRSVRWYEQRPVPREVIDRAVEVAGLSPSACNRQPFEFRIFDDPEIVRRLADIPMGTRGFSHQFPVFIVVVGKLHAYPYNRDRHVIYIDASLASMALQFALEVQGVASCSINWPDIAAKDRMMAEAIGLAPDERVIMCMSAGYPDPDGLVPFSQKKSLDELRSYNAL